MSHDDLIARILDSVGPNRELDAEIARDVTGVSIHGWPEWIVTLSCAQNFPALGSTPHYTRDWYDVLTLLPDDCSWNVGWEAANPHGMAWVGNSEAMTAATPVLALCAAALKARCS